ncbi:putative eivH, partial [Escherichia coli 95.0183]
CINCLSFRKIV